MTLPAESRLLEALKITASVHFPAASEAPFLAFDGGDPEAFISDLSPEDAERLVDTGWRATDYDPARRRWVER